MMMCFFYCLWIANSLLFDFYCTSIHASLIWYLNCPWLFYFINSPSVEVFMSNITDVAKHDAVIDLVMHRTSKRMIVNEWFYCTVLYCTTVYLVRTVLSSIFLLFRLSRLDISFWAYIWILLCRQGLCRSV